MITKFHLVGNCRTSAKAETKSSPLHILQYIVSRMGRGQIFWFYPIVHCSNSGNKGSLQANNVIVQKISLNSVIGPEN